MKFWLLVMLVLPLAATAEVYRSVDAQGNVSYSDTPGPGAEAVDVPEVSTYQPPVYSQAGATAADGATPGTAASGYTLKILKPVQGSTLRSDSGRLEVELTVTPALRGTGHTLMYRLDNQPAAATSTPRFALLGLQRGDHTFTAWISDASGKPLGAQQTVQFQLIRGSALSHPIPGNGGEGSGVQQAPRAPMAPRAPRPDVPRQYTPTPAP